MLKSFQNDKDLLEQKVDALQSDLKTLLLNRKKLENIEDLIVSYSGMKDLSNTNNNIIYDSFKEKSYNMNSSNSMNPFNKAMVNEQKVNKVEKDSTPNWYINLKNKNSKLNN